MVLGTIGLGWWISEEIKNGIIRETAATTALYVDGFIAPIIQELDEDEWLTNEHMQLLDSLWENTDFYSKIVSFKIWNAHGRIVYSSEPALRGQLFPIGEELARSWQGEVTAAISGLEDDENVLERVSYSRLLEIYAPVRRHGTDEILAVAEFYQTADDLDAQIISAQRRSWGILGATMLVIYLLLIGFARWANDTIVQQQGQLSDQVVQLTNVLKQNEELYEWLRRASANVTELNELFLRRISAELHDGPAQDLGLALLRLDRIAAHLTTEIPNGQADVHPPDEDLEAVQRSMRHALQEVRAIAAGLTLPQLESLSLNDTITRVVNIHQRRTGTKVVLYLQDLPQEVTMPAKITAYRVIQEALSNAYRHAASEGQTVQAGMKGGYLSIEIADAGPGFDIEQPGHGREDHLGLSGMRERVESLGGLFQVKSRPGQGTRVIARIPL